MIRSEIWYRTHAAATIIWLGLSTSAPAGTVAWTGTAGDNLWRDGANWSSGTVPDSTTDVILGDALTAGTVINASPPPMSFTPEVANSVTITTANPFTMSSGLLPDSISLTSGNLARPLGPGVGADQNLNNLGFGLDTSGVWNIGGAGTLTVGSVVTNGPATLITDFTKSGNGTLYVRDFEITGATILNQGTLRLDFANTTGVSVAGGAELQLSSNTVLGGLERVPVTLLRGTVLTGDGRLHSLGGSSFVGRVTLAGRANPITVDAGVLTVNGITDAGAGLGWNKNGAGTVALAGPGTYHGTTFVNTGVVDAQRSDALGSGGVVVAAGATLQLLGDRVINSGDVSVSNPITLGGTLSGGGFFSNPQVASGPITLTGNVILDGSLLVSGPMTDNGSGFSVTKTGDGTTILGGAYTVSGPLIATQGILRTTVPLPSGLPTTVQSGATFDLQNNVTIDRPLQLAGPGSAPGLAPSLGALASSSGNNTWAGAITLQADSSVGASSGASLTLTGPVSGAFAVTKIGGGTLVLTNPSNNFVSLTIAEGVLSASSPAPLPATAPITVNAGASVRLSGNASMNQAVNLNGSASSFGALDNQADNNNWQGPVTLQSDTSVSSTAGQLTISGNISGAFNLTKSGPGELVLAGSNSHNNTLVNQGVLTLASNSALRDGTTATVAAGATLAIDNNSTSSATATAHLSGAGVTGQAALFNSAANNMFAGPVVLESNPTLGAAAGTTLTLPNQVSDDTAPMPLVKVGPGTVALTGANTYRGGTIVNAGALAINSDAALGDAAGQVTLNNGGKLLISSNMSTARVFNLNTGSIQVNPGITLSYNGATVSGGYLRGPGTHAISGAANFSGVIALPDSTIAQNAATTLNNFTNSGALANNAPLTWDGGYITSAGRFTVNSTANTSAFENNGAVTIANAATLSNSGTALVSGGGSVINVNSGGTLDVSANSLELFGSLLLNNGHVNGPVNVHFNALAAGTGSFGPVNLFDNGRFAPGATADPTVFSPAAVNVSGDARFAPASSLLVQIGGKAAGVGFDQVNVAGSAALGGTLAISTTNNFVPAGLDSFKVLSYSSHTGTFSAYSVAGAANALAYAPIYGSNDLTLIATLRGDANLDGKVDFADLLTLAQNYGKDVSMLTDSSWTLGDFNGDGKVDFSDLLLLAQHYGQSALSPGAAAPELSETASVPEPAPGVLLALLIPFSRRQRRRDSVAPPPPVIRQTSTSCWRCGTSDIRAASRPTVPPTLRPPRPLPLTESAASRSPRCSTTLRCRRCI